MMWHKNKPFDRVNVIMGFLKLLIQIIVVL